MGRPDGPESRPDPEDETRQLPPVSLETTEFIALDPSEDPVAEIASPSFPPAFRGYDRRAVDAYVMRVTEIVAELHAARSPRAAVKRALERVGRETTGILQNARETADEITVQSRARAEERRQEAEREAQRLRREAEAHVRALDAATDEIWVERRRILDSTLQLGERLQAMAQEAAAEFPADGEDQAEGRRGGPRATSNGSKEDATEQSGETAKPSREPPKKPVSPEPS